MNTRVDMRRDSGEMRVLRERVMRGCGYGGHYAASAALMPMSITTWFTPRHYCCHILRLCFTPRYAMRYATMPRAIMLMLPLSRFYCGIRSVMSSQVALLIRLRRRCRISDLICCRHSHVCCAIRLFTRDYAIIYVITPCRLLLMIATRRCRHFDYAMPRCRYAPLRRHFADILMPMLYARHIAATRRR